jgi:hypothetical protein
MSKMPVLILSTGATNSEHSRKMAAAVRFCIRFPVDLKRANSAPRRPRVAQAESGSGFQKLAAR